MTPARYLPPDAQALARCIARCASADDGRGRRHPVRHCAAALQALGTTPAIAQACADAARAVGMAIAARAAGGADR